MVSSFWNATYRFAVPDNLVLGVALLLVAGLFVWRLTWWRAKNPGVALHSTPWSVWYPVAFFLISGMYIAGYGVHELL